MKKGNRKHHGKNGLKDFTQEESVASAQSEKIRDSDKKCGNFTLNFGIDMKKGNRKHHGKNRLKDFTQEESVASAQSEKIRDSDNMKQGWEIKKLGDVCDFQNGFAFQSKTYKENGLPILRITNIQNDEIDTNELVFFDTKDYKVNLDRFKVYQGDLLIAMSGATTGKLGINNSETVFYLNQRVGKFIPKKQLNKAFLYYFLTTKVEESLRIAAGAAQPNLSTEQINNFQIPLPPLPEQQRIVSILDECFAAIDKAKANAEQNLKNAKELFESYLQGVFENGNWETKTIEAVCNEIFAGGDAPKNNFSLEPNEKHNIPIYANAVKDRGLYGYTDFARVTKPCVTIAARGSGTGHTELREESFLPIVRLIVCIPDTNLISNEFLKYTIDNLVIQRSGSAIPQLTVPMIKDYKIPVPTIEEQKIIIEKAEMLKEQKENLENVYLKKIKGLDELKKSILQKAFAGELRGGKTAESKTEKSRRDGKIIKNKINNNKQTPKG
jgi:type I restriction enzyme S subunit